MWTNKLPCVDVYSISGGSSWSNQLAAFFSHSLSNAPLATNLVKYPVLLYSPGWSGHRRENTDKVEDLASWGYVVVGLDHRDTYLSVFPDGTLVHGQADCSVSCRAIEDRLLDEQFVLDELESLNASDPRLAGGWIWMRLARLDGLWVEQPRRNCVFATLAAKRALTLTEPTLKPIC